METGCQALATCFQSAKTTANDIDLLIVCTSTGYVCPDLASRLMFLDPTVLGPGGATYFAQLNLFWYGPGTFDMETDSACELTDVMDTGCNFGDTGSRATPPTGINLPALTDADTMLAFMSLYGDASTDGFVSDPASVIISNLPPGVSIISEGGGTYTAAVPEPASWMMTAAIGVGLLWMGRKRRSAKRAAAD